MEQWVSLWYFPHVIFLMYICLSASASSFHQESVVVAFYNRASFSHVSRTAGIYLLAALEATV